MNGSSDMYSLDTTRLQAVLMQMQMGTLYVMAQHAATGGSKEKASSLLKRRSVINDELQELLELMKGARDA